MFRIALLIFVGLAALSSSAVIVLPQSVGGVVTISFDSTGMFMYATNKSGVLFQLGLGEDENIVKLFNSVNLNSSVYYTFTDGIETAEFLFFGTGESTLIQVDQRSLIITQTLDLSAIVPPSWFGGYALDQRTHTVLLTGNYSAAVVSLFNNSAPSAANGMQLQCVRLLSELQHEPLSGAVVDSLALFTATNDTDGAAAIVVLLCNGLSNL